MQNKDKNKTGKIADREVSYQKRVTGPVSKVPQSIVSAIADIRSGKYKSKVDLIRKAIKKGSTDTAQKLKESLPTIIPAGTFSKKGNSYLIKSSGLACLDFDNVKDLTKKKKELQKHASVYAFWDSPSGNGIKALVVIPQVKDHNEYSAIYTQLGKEFPDLDRSCKDISRACFVSYDPKVWVNKKAIVFKTTGAVVSNSSPAGQPVGNSEDFATLENLVAQIERKRVDITEGYEKWRNIGFVLAQHGEPGRKLYHKVSRFNEAYNAAETDRQFDKCLAADVPDNPVGTATFIDYCREVEVTAQWGKGIKKKSKTAEAPKGLPSRESLRMTFKYEKKNELPALTLNDTTLINFGEIFVLVGLPGAGKSAMVEAIITAHRGVDNFGFRFNTQGKKALLIDTERHPDDVYNSYTNIAARLGGKKAPKDRKGEIKDFVYLTLSELSSVNDLKAILERELATGEFDLVALDGILDFCESMNDDKDATEVVKWVRALAVKHNCAAVVTIHPNKASESIAGHLGAMLYRWARAILFVRNVPNGLGVKELTADTNQAKLSHGDISTFQPVYFCWDGMKQLLMPCDYSPKPEPRKISEMQETFNNLYAEQEKYHWKDLIKKVVETTGKSESTAERWVEKARVQGILTKKHNHIVLAST